MPMTKTTNGCYRYCAYKGIAFELVLLTMINLHRRIYCRAAAFYRMFALSLLSIYLSIYLPVSISLSVSMPQREELIDCYFISSVGELIPDKVTIFN